MKKVLVCESKYIKIIDIKDTFKYRCYVLRTGCLYILKCSPKMSRAEGDRWAWYSILGPNSTWGGIFDSFDYALEYGVSQGDVYEISDYQDLSDFLLLEPGNEIL